MDAAFGASMESHITLCSVKKLVTSTVLLLTTERRNVVSGLTMSSPV
jgi:hypothetical protein